MNNKEDLNTVPDTSKISKQKQPNRNEPPTSENGHYTTKERITNTNTRTKGKSRKIKENYEQGKDYLTITKKH